MPAAIIEPEVAPAPAPVAKEVAPAPVAKKDPKAVVANECRFVVYSKSNLDQDPRDIHLVKERVHHADGTTSPNVRVIHNYERPFWVAKKGAQNYKDKKEWAPLKDLTEFKSTQSQLALNVAKALGKSWMRNPTMRDLSKDPYLYGTDILSTSVLKQSYRDKWDVQTPFSVAVYDTETDMIHGHGQIMMATVSFKERVFTVVQKSFVAGYPNAVEKIEALANQYIGDVIEARKIKLEILIVDAEIDVVKLTLAKCHEWQPDLVSVWNLPFDIEKILDACARAKVDPADLFCDPAVPAEFRTFDFKKGAAKKTTAAGRVMSFKPAQRWHTVLAPSSFYWVDGMCIYKQVRISEPDQPSYGLDALMKKHLEGRGKLKFDAADHVEKAEWHRFMQSRYPLEYVVYNIFDCVGMELLDEETLDCQLSFPMFAGNTDFQHFNKQPKRAINELHYFVLKHGHVIGTTSSEMADDFDDETTGVDGWIVMLPSHLVADNGLQLIEEHPELRTNIRVHVGDLDVAASYPNGECVFNISKETTSKELIDIVGVPEHVQRMQTINLSAGHTNAVEFCTALYGLPTLDQLLDAFMAQDAAPPMESLMDQATDHPPLEQPITDRSYMHAQLVGMSQRMMEEGISNPSPEDRVVPLPEGYAAAY